MSIGKRISELAQATTVDGTEKLEIVQSSANKYALLSLLRDTAAAILTKLKTVDGPGSGLDADTVSGYGIGTAALVELTPTQLEATVKGGLYTVTSVSGITSSPASVLILPYQYNMAQQIVIQYNDPRVMYIRTVTVGGTIGAWIRLWNSENDGAASGLETDLVPNATPASAGAAGTAGMIRYDASYIYICTATNTWERVAIAGW